MESELFSQFSGRRYINLESYKLNGEPKLTPVQSVGRGGLVYIRTGPRTWKVKRIRRNPQVRIVLSDRSGKSAGSWVPGEARLVEGEERDRAMQIFREEYGAVGNLLIGFVGRLRGERRTTVIAIGSKPNQQASAQK